MKVRRILIIILIAVIITAAFTIGLEFLSKRNNTPGTITDEPIVVTINPQTPDTEEGNEPSNPETEIAESSSSQTPDTTSVIEDETEETSEPAAEQAKREIVNFETDPAKIVVPDDTHDELEIRVKAIIEENEENENDVPEDGNTNSTASAKKKTSSDGPNVGLLILLGVLVLAFVGVFFYMNKLKNGGGKKKGY